MIAFLLAEGALARFLWRETHWIPSYLYPLLIAATILGATILVAGPSARQRIAAATTAIFSTGLAAALTERVLKPLFSRMDVSRALASNDFGFHPLHGGAHFRSFPSGHAASLAACVAVFWLCYPRTRPIGAALVIAVSLALAILRRHFLGDVLAGDLTGFLVAAAVVETWNGIFRAPVTSPAPIASPQP